MHTSLLDACSIRTSCIGNEALKSDLILALGSAQHGLVYNYSTSSLYRYLS
jgi:hypothetical protein